MKKTILVFGLISGAIVSLMMAFALFFQDKLGTHSLVIGYTSIVLAMLLTFFGIRSYRDNVGNGQITFGKALAVGISIAIVSSLFYVATWEVIYYNFMPDFMDKYTAHRIEEVKNSGETAAVIQQKVDKLNKMKDSYKNPFVNMAMTFIEPFPVGLVIALISAAALRRKAPQQAQSAAAA